MSIFKFEDGWSIEWVDSAEELSAEDNAVHNGRSCLGYDADLWLERMSNGDYFLASLQDSEGQRKATILMGEAERVKKTRTEDREYRSYDTYAHCRVYDDEPRNFNGTFVLALQCCPPGFMAGDVSGISPEYHRVKEWWDGLERSK